MAMRAASWTFPPVFIVAFLTAQANGNHHAHAHAHAPAHGLGVSSLHASYICPEGANVTLVCTQSGSKAHPMDALQHAWFFTPHMDQRCEHILPRRTHGNRTLGVVHRLQVASFSLTLLELTAADQGRYCCQIVDTLVWSKTNHTMFQHAHSYMLLTVSPRHNNSLKCIELDQKVQGNSGAVWLATMVCIIGILCLPLLLVLVYRQRQGPHMSRRAHELVRMDSEAQGHDNPVFTGGSPRPQYRPVSAILTRQASESGHLLSAPGTPFTPNTHGEVFFPAQEPIPESHDFLPA
ncbi:V-type immunoglobulin domain-containing suppressor of T-cell activation [Electrophorus electricus]|uniref:Ig-like domain-containing protein n=1 Tax=Electrophorus electricus TaxID=8005 RepID=A0A4W4GSJ2_ELEEL|nr:V-type immunoglobulin domain-containing suppressor of T-cell activation [Electrophorus electricus]